MRKWLSSINFFVYVPPDFRQKQHISNRIFDETDSNDKMVELEKRPSSANETTLTSGNLYPSSTLTNKNMSYNNGLMVTALININGSLQQESSIHPSISLAYSGYHGMKLAPWLTGIIFALVVFVILIPAICSACYHYYRYWVYI